MTALEQQIKQLRSEGMTYRKIAETLKCSNTVVSYHLASPERKKNWHKNRKSRAKHPLKYKMDIFKGKKTKIYNKYKYFKRDPITGEVLKTFTYIDLINKLGENPICYLTGRPIDFNDTASYQLDHIVPKSKGGFNTLDNLGLTCAEANKAKYDLPLNEFLDLCEEILKHHKRI